MREKKWYKISLFVGICVLINYAGKIFCTKFTVAVVF